MTTNGRASGDDQRPPSAPAAGIRLTTLNGATAPGVRALLCTAHGTLQPVLDADDIDRFIAEPANALWLDLDTAETEDLSLLQREFAFHELAVEDATRKGQRPKIDQYDGFAFLVFYAVTDAALAEGLRLCEVAMFVGPNYLVTVHEGAVTELEETAARWQRNIERVDSSIGALLYSLLDSITDNYFPVVDAVADAVEEIEASVFEQFDERALEDIFRLKKALLGMQRVVAPERDVMNVLIRRDLPLLGERSVAYFQDVYDHLVRVTDSIDIYRDLLSSVLDAYLSMASHRLNQVIKTLASWTIPLMAGALITGIYGMNFDYMPELHWRLGYLWALALIGGAMLTIVLYFWRKRWF
jgi:magnesium transporter